MAEILGVPYREIAFAALVPALLYVLALIIAVRLEAGKLDLACDTAGGWRLLRETLAKRGYLLLPLIGLIVLLARGMTPTQSAVYCIVFALAISPWRRDTRLGAIDLVVVCRNTRSEEHTSELQSLMRISYAVFCLKKKNNQN